MDENRILSDEILLGLIKKNGGGGGGGTTNYNQLENKPQIADVTLSGNKSLADLGIASAQSVSNITNGESINNFADVETALSGKQDALTAGNYIAIENDGTIKVTQSIGVYDVYSYKIEGRVSGTNYWTNVIKYKNGIQQSSNTYTNMEAVTPINIDDRLTLQYVMNGVTWHVILLTDSTEHQTGEDISWKYNVTKDFTENFNVSQDSSTDLATKGDVNTAISGKQDILTFDDTPTDGSNNPVKSNGIYDALATKADTDMVAADFNAGTSYTAGNYCVQDGKLYRFKNNHSGAWSSADVDEVKITGELSALKSGLTNLDFINYGAIDTASNFVARLSKVSNIAFLSVGDFVSLSAGETVLTGKIPVGYRPVLDVDFTLIQRNVSPRILAFSVKSDGNISLYNYGAEISSATAFADTLAWPIGS